MRKDDIKHFNSFVLSVLMNILAFYHRDKKIFVENKHYLANPKVVAEWFRPTVKLLRPAKIQVQIPNYKAIINNYGTIKSKYIDRVPSFYY